jgi:hypothetical protein
MSGRAGANVVEMPFVAEDAGVTIGLPEEAAVEATPAGAADGGDARKKPPLFGWAREKLAGGSGKASAAFPGSKTVKQAEPEAAAEAGSLGSEESVISSSEDGAQVKRRGRFHPKLMGGASLVALIVAAGLALLVMPVQRAPVATGGTEAHGGEPKEDAHMMAPLAKLAEVRPREAVPEPVEVRPRPAAKDDLVAEIAALGPASRVSDGSPKEKKEAGEGGEAPAAVAPAKRQMTPSSPVPEAVSAVKPQQDPTEAMRAASADPHVLDRAALPAPASQTPEGSKVVFASGVTESVKPAPAPAAVEAAEPGIKENAAEASMPHGHEPLTRSGETMVMGMITELSAVTKTVGDEIKALKAEQKKLVEATGGKLADFERRLSIGEARRALDGAKAVVTEASLPGEAGGAGEAALSPPKPLLAPGKHAGPKPEKASVETALHYRVRAASPGLAMLAAVEETGDESKPVQVGVGGEVPGYGRVKKIAQRGLAWVVETEKGEIR